MQRQLPTPCSTGPTTPPWAHRGRRPAQPRRGGGPGRTAGGLAAGHRSPGPFHVAVMLDNVPEFIFWIEAAAWSAPWWSGPTPPTAATSWPATWPTPSASCPGHRLHLPPPGRRPADRRRPRDRSNPTTSGSSSSTTPATRPSAPGPPSARPPPSTWSTTVVTPESLGYLLFTSGTSGAPKACLCSQGRLARIGAIVAQMYALTGRRLLPGHAALPLQCPHGRLGPRAHGRLHRRAALDGPVLRLRLPPDVRAAGATYFNYVGKPLAYILATPEQPDDADNPLMRAFGNEGSADDVARFAERFAVSVTDAYGSTEGGATVARTPDTPPGALGRAPEGTVVLDAATGEECPPARFDDAGACSTPRRPSASWSPRRAALGFEGYWRNDDAERARLREGWYWTGDLAYRDEAGFFYFAGRDHDWLRVDGENFASAPIERILQRHPDVVLAAVYAVPDPVVGDQVMAAVQLRPGVDRSTRPDWPTSWPPRATSAPSGRPASCA
jgi:fatty-acyl-CoA synthase